MLTLRARDHETGFCDFAGPCRPLFVPKIEVLMLTSPSSVLACRMPSLKLTVMLTYMSVEFDAPQLITAFPVGV